MDTEDIFEQLEKLPDVWSVGDTQNMVMDELGKCKEIAEKRGWPIPQLKIEFDLTGGTAGQAWFPQAGVVKIRINMHIARSEGTGYRSTVAHEYAHAITFMLQQKIGIKVGSDPHGDLWAAVMRAFGYEAQRCHNYASMVVNRKQRFPIKCKCGRIFYGTKTILRRMQQGVQYKCREC